jgi:Xaa-Pro aminopeptidase
MPTSPSDRIEKLADELRREGTAAYLAWSPVSMQYLQGFAEGAGERFLTLAVRDSGETRLICPALSETQARRSGIEDVRPWKDGEDPLEHFRELAADWDLPSATLAVDDEMPAQMLLAMQSALPEAPFFPSLCESRIPGSFGSCAKRRRSPTVPSLPGWGRWRQVGRSFMWRRP